MTTLKNQRIAKVIGPALLLVAALALPPAGQADSSPKGKAHAAADHKNDKKPVKVVKVQKVKQVQVKQVTPPRRVVVVQPRTVVVPVAARPQRYRWDGWNRRYSRYSSRVFQLDGTFVDREQGCAIVQDHQGQVIPLVGFDPTAPRRGDHFLLVGRVQTNTACGTAFRVDTVERVWGDPNHRRVLFDRRYDGDYFAYDRRRDDDRYDRDRYDDRYDRDDDRRSDNRRLISVDGRLDRDRCPSIRTNDGRIFGLDGDLRNYRDGEWVHIVGFLDGRSRCGGTGLQVGEITGG